MSTLSDKIENHEYTPSGEYADLYKGNPDQRAKFHDERVRLNAQFKIDLLEELAITGHPKADMLFDMAWDRGHSSGFAEVLLEAQLLVEFLR